MQFSHLKKKKSHLALQFQYQSKGMVKLHFLEQFYIKAKPWHQIKPRRKTTGAEQHFKNGRICETHRTHVGLQRANTSQILRLRQYQVKNSVGFGNWTQYKAAVNENHVHYVIASPNLMQVPRFFFNGWKEHGGKHGNADMLWALNAWSSSCFALYTHIWGTIRPSVRCLRYVVLMLALKIFCVMNNNI